MVEYIHTRQLWFLYSDYHEPTIDNNVDYISYELMNYPDKNNKLCRS